MKLNFTNNVYNNFFPIFFPTTHFLWTTVPFLIHVRWSLGCPQLFFAFLCYSRFFTEELLGPLPRLPQSKSAWFVQTYLID